LNAISNIPFRAKVLLPLLAIISLWLLSGEDSNKDANQLNTINRSTDYSMSNFTMTIMDKSGHPSRIIIGQEMSHYPEDDSTEIIFPIAQFIDSEKETWIVSSEKGETQGKGEDILLTGNVIITRENNKDIELHTEALHLDTVRNTAYTDLAVTLKSPYGETNAIGLHAALEDKMLNLHSRVRGKYDAPSAQ